MTPKQTLPLQFPAKGITENTAYADIPGGFTSDALNVRPFDPARGRMRGGKRTGTNNVFDSLDIKIVKMVQATQSSIKMLPPEFGDREDAPVAPGGQPESMAFSPDGDYLAVAHHGTPYISVYAVSNGVIGAKVANPAVLPAGPGNAVAWSPDGSFLAVAHDNAPNISVYNWTGTGFGAKEANPGTAVPADGLGVGWSPNGDYLAVAHGNSPYVSVYSWSGGFGAKEADAGTPPPGASAGFSVAWNPDGTYIAVGHGGGGDTTYLSVYEWAAGFGSRLSNPADLPSSAVTHVKWLPNGAYLLAHGAGTDFSMYEFDPSGGGTIGARVGYDILSDVVTNGYSSGYGVAVTSDGQTILSTGQGGSAINNVSAPRAWTFLHGVFSEPAAIPSDNPAVTPFDAGRGIAVSPDDAYVAVGYTEDPWVSVFPLTPGGEGAAQRATYLAVVAGPHVFRSNEELTTLTLATDGLNAVSGTVYMGAAEGPASPEDDPSYNTHRFVYMSDGATYTRLDIDDNTMRTWTAHAGSLPAVGGQTARIMCLYRGRIVLSGITDDPQNWYMSRVDDPRDWDYAPASPSPLDAIAGNNSDAGKVGDLITCLIPYSDDLLIFGGDHTIWQLTGDPGAGGRIDNISYDKGILGPDSWTRDPQGNLYFMGTDGFNMIPAGGGQPVLISAGKLDQTFSGVNRSTTRVILAWNRDKQGCHIFFAKNRQEAAGPIQYWFDARTQSFWKEQYPANNGPSAVLVYDGDAATDRAVLLGGWDGYIRKVVDGRWADHDGSGDDVAIESYVDFPLLRTEGTRGRVMLSDATIVLGEGSGDTTLSVYGAETPEANVRFETVPKVARVLKQGLNRPIRHHIADNTLRLRLSQTSATQTWSFEDGELAVSGAGRQRKEAR